MTRIQSNMLPLGTQASLFKLQDVVSHKLVSLKPDSDFAGTVIMFICNHCPFVKHVNPEIVRIANDYLKKNIRFYAVSSNDVANYPDDSPENMELTAKTQQYPFPYLYDDTQEVARAYHAACTPDFFLFDSSLRLVYRGQLDDSRPGNNLACDGQSLRDALDALLAGKPVSTDQRPSIGCNIKWKT